MSLNIKSDRVHDLVRQAADRSGLSQTSVVERAIQEYLDRLDAENAGESAGLSWRARVDRLLDDVDRRLTDDQRAALVGEDLYDANGLPA